MGSVSLGSGGFLVSLWFPWGQTELEFIVEKILNRSDPGAITGLSIGLTPGLSYSGLLSRGYWTPGLFGAIDPGAIRGYFTERITRRLLDAFERLDLTTNGGASRGQGPCPVLATSLVW